MLLGGGIGSGKSTAAGVLAAFGAAVFSADEAGHRALEPGEPAYALVAKRWPEVIVGGRVDRTALGRIVFADADELRALESVSHPAIRDYLRARIGESDAEVIVVEMPLLQDLFGPGWLWMVVDAADELRLKRLVHHGMNRADAEARIAVQASRREWLDAAEIVIDNSGNLEHLAGECERAWEAILS